MKNAKDELLEEIGNKEVERVKIELCFGGEVRVAAEGTLEKVLPVLNFVYDNGYGQQELYGVIWYKDGTWSERAQYDGSEWWEFKERPSFNIEFETQC